MNIISLSGPRKTGKTYIAKLMAEIDSRIQVISFADILKDTYARKKGIDRAVLDDVIEKEKHRQGIVDLGDEERAKDRYVFAIGLANTLRPDGFYVIDDTRRIEELEVMMKLGAIPYGVYAPPHVRAARGFRYDSRIDEHPAETELALLSSYTYHCLGGGYFYNTKGSDYIRDQAFKVVRKHFPFKMEDLKHLGKKKVK